VVIADSAETTANAAWNEGTLETDEWEEWLGDHRLYRVMLDKSATDGVSSQQWLSIASGFTDKNGWIYLPLIVLYGPDGKKLTQFTPYDELAEASEFIEVLEYYLNRYSGFIKPGPGRIGFTKQAVTLSPATTASGIDVTVTRSGGTGAGAQAFLLRTHDGSAVSNEHYVAVSTNLTWAAGDSSSRTVRIPLLTGDDGWRQPSNCVFNVTLAKGAGATAEIGATNLTVTFASPFTADTNWVYDAMMDCWNVGPLASNETAVLSWTAPQAGLLTFECGWAGADTGGVWVDFPGASTNGSLEANSTIALTNGACVTWCAAECEAFVALMDWRPLNAPVPRSPADGAAFRPANLPTLEWDVPAVGDVILCYGATTAVRGEITNAVSGVGAAELGLTNNAVYYWRMDSVATGAVDTVARVAGPLRRFEITERPAFPSASTNVTTYLNIPARFQFAAESAEAVTYSAQGLPSGLTIGKTDGAVSGTPTRAGTFAATVTAKSAKGTAALAVTLTVAPLPAYASGTFQGMLETGGMVTLSVSSAGVPTLKTETGGKAQTLKGVWLDMFTAQFKTKAGDVISVTFTSAGTAFTGIAAGARQVLTQSAAIAPYIGYYTGVLAATNVLSGALGNTPAGYGYLTFSVAKTGIVKYAGKLADGTSVSGSAKLASAGAPGTAAIPLYKPLYARRGDVAAYVTFTDGGAVSLAGEWLYPGKSAKLPEDRFAAEVSGAGAYYVKTVKPAQLAAMYTNSVLAVADGECNLESVKGKLAAEAGSGVKLSVTASTGLFTGSFAADTKKQRTFKGALIPETAVGAGHWLLPVSTNGYRINTSQPVEIKAIP
jgi:hypothetical protein